MDLNKLNLFNEYDKDIIIESLLMCIQEEDETYCTEAVDDLEIEELLESANSDIRYEFKKCKKRFKEQLKLYKKAIKNKDFKEAKKYLENCKKEIKYIKKEINNMDSSVSDVFTGWLFVFFIDLAKTFLSLMFISIGATPIAYAALLKNDSSIFKLATNIAGTGEFFVQIKLIVTSIRDIYTVFDQLNKGKGVTNSFNLYRGRLIQECENLSLYVSWLEKNTKKKEQNNK